MRRLGIVFSLALLTPILSGCACPKCPIDSQDGVGVALIKNPNAAERGAIASVLQVLTAQAGPESPEVVALHSALASRRMVIGRFHPSPRHPETRGYVMMKNGRIALDLYFVRAAPPDSNYLADRRTWPLMPILFAAGYRLVHGGTWRDSVTAAGAFADELADGVESDRVAGALPAGTDRADLARFLRNWKQIY